VKTSRVAATTQHTAVTLELGVQAERLARRCLGGDARAAAKVANAVRM
jgi:hypothetical protein